MTEMSDKSGASDPVRLGPLEAEPPLRFGAQWQLLVDTWLLSDWWRLRRIQEKVSKHPGNPILQADQPWEQGESEVPGTHTAAAVYDEKDDLYKLWYSIQTRPHGIGYAVSRDGVNWTKPDLGLVEFGGTTHNNVCRLDPAGKPLNGLHLVQDARGDERERRFKGISIMPYHQDGTRYGTWIGIGFSADGTTWHEVAGGTIGGCGGGNPSCVWDESLGRYVLFQRQHSEMALYGDWIGKYDWSSRHIVRQESENLADWSARRTVFNTAMDPKWTEVESMMVFRHEGIYFGLPQMLDNHITGELEIHLVTSRDGYHWERPYPPEAFIPRGPRGDFDDMMTFLPMTVIHGDEVRFYYSGEMSPHTFGKSYVERKPIVEDGEAVGAPAGSRPGKIGLATVPLNRLAGLRADEPIGAFLTRPFVVEGDELYVNANVDRELRVEVVDPVVQVVDTGEKRGIPVGHYIVGREQRYPGFEREDCEVVLGDSLRHRVRWSGGSIGKLRGRTVRLRVMARMATIYALQVQ